MGRGDLFTSPAKLKFSSLRREPLHQEGWQPSARKPDFKCGAAFGAVVAGDLSLVVLDYAVGGAKSEAGAFADRLGGVERIEDALGIAQAGAGVGKLDDHFAGLAPERDLETSAAGFL